MHVVTRLPEFLFELNNIGAIFVYFPISILPKQKERFSKVEMYNFGNTILFIMKMNLGQIKDFNRYDYIACKRGPALLGVEPKH